MSKFLSWFGYFLMLAILGVMILAKQMPQYDHTCMIAALILFISAMAVREAHTRIWLAGAR